MAELSNIIGDDHTNYYFREATKLAERTVSRRAWCNFMRDSYKVLGQ
jgi:hypothetical protein